MTDATAEDILGGPSGWKRQKKSAEVEIAGEKRTIYYYDPPSVAERDAFQSQIKYADSGEKSFSLAAIVDGIIARVKDANGRPLFRQIHRSRMLEMPQDVLLDIWSAIGGANVQSAAELAEAAEKK